jgi:hypothetical protein
LRSSYLREEVLRNRQLSGRAGGLGATFRLAFTLQSYILCNTK